MRTSFEDTPVDALDMTFADDDDGGPSLWPLRAVLFASACIVVGVIWDISWHSTIGRDTFWTLPHLLEQLGALVAGMSCGWLALRVTFAPIPKNVLKKNSNTFPARSAGPGM